MKWEYFWFLVAVSFAVVAWGCFLASPVNACEWSWCGESEKPTRSYITNTHRQVQGDLYDPGNGRRVQIRNKHRQIIGYIEKDGRVTNTHRQTVKEIEVERTN